MNGKFTGSIVNPITDARLSAAYSLQRLAKRLNVSKQYISRAEHGTYRTLNTQLVSFAADELSIHTERVMQMYRAFQTAVRNKTVLDVGPEQLNRHNSTLPGREIFSIWRQCYWPSITAFSNAFCIHPEIIRAYEEGAREEIPTEIRELLGRFNLIDPNWTEAVASIKSKRDVMQSNRDFNSAIESSRPLVPRSPVRLSESFSKRSDR